MREIKFRAWDTQSKSWASFSTFTGYLSPNRDVWPQEWSFPVNDFVLVQYTGLKDKNGREIYEGDIVTGWVDESGGHSTEPEVVVFDPRHGFRINSWPFWQISGFRVLGNIYENPELVKEEQGASNG